MPSAMTEASLNSQPANAAMATETNHNNNQTSQDDHAEIEAQSLSKEPFRKPGFFSRARALGPVTKNHGDLPLLVCCFVTGLVDAASFRNWGMFIGMQTGNTVILGLSTAGLPENPHVWLTTLVSILAFLAGALVTFRLSAFLLPLGPTRNRLGMCILFFAQAVLLLLSAGLAQSDGLIPQNPRSTSTTSLDPADVLHNIRIVSLIPPLAFQSGMQIAVSRLLGYNELPVNVLTSTYCDIMGDMRLLALNNVKRNRRVLAVVLVLAGAISSGWMLRGSGGLPSVLWLGGGLKLSTAVALFCFLPAVEESI